MKMHALKGLCGVAALLATTMLASAQPADLTPREAELYAAAKPEGSITWYVSQFNTEDADAVCRLFTERYPDVKCNAVRATGQVIYQRLMQEIGAGAMQADVFSTNDVAQMVELKATDKLVEYTPDNLQYMVPAIRKFGEPGYWFTSSIAPYAIGYNTNLVSEADAPRNWTDLLDPKWKDQVAIPHPGFSGSAGTWVIAMRDMYGWEFFDKLEENKPQISRSVADSANLIVSGERKIAVVPVNRAAVDAYNGAPVEPVYPTDGLVLPPGSTGLLAGAPHPNAAKLFAEFILGKEVANYYQGDQRFPLRADTTPPETLKPLDDMKFIMVEDKKVVTDLPEVQDKFRDTFGI